MLVWPSLDARYPVPLLLPFSSRTIEENKIKKSVVEIKTWRSINASTTKGEKKKSLDLMEINLLKIRFIRWRRLPLGYFPQAYLHPFVSYSVISSSPRGAKWMENGHCIQFITINLSLFRLLYCSSMGSLLQDKPAAPWVLHQTWSFSNVFSSMDSAWEWFLSGKINLFWCTDLHGIQLSQCGSHHGLQGTTALVPGAPPHPPSFVTSVCTGSHLVFLFLP